MDDTTKKPTHVLLKMANPSVYVVGEVYSENDNELLVRYPIVLEMHHYEDEFGVSLRKYAHFAKGDLVAFNKSAVVGWAAPSEELVARYVKFKGRWAGAMDRKTEQAILGTTEGSGSDDDDGEEEQATSRLLGGHSANTLH